MIELNGFSMRDFLTFEDTELNISSKNGLYVVTGDNKDSSLRDDTNAVGKSRLLSSIPSVLIEHDPSALGKNNRKDIHKSPKSMLTVDFTSHAGKRLSVTQKSSKYVISEIVDGKETDQQAIKLEAARSLIRQNFPIKESLFYSTVYISTKDCAFQRSKPAERLTFVSDIFDLEIYDLLRKELTKQLSVLAGVEVSYKVYAENLLQNQTALGELKKNKSLSYNLDSLTKKENKLTKTLRKLFEQQGELRAYAETKETISDLKSEIKTLEKKWGSKLNTSTKELSSLIRQIEKTVEYTQRHKKLTKLVNDYKTDVPSEDIERKYEDLKERQRELKTTIKEGQRFNDEAEQVNREIKSVAKKLSAVKESLSKSKLKSVVDLSDVYAVQEFIATSKTLISLFESVDHKHKGKKCPLCESNFDASTLKNRVKLARVYLEEYSLYKEYQTLKSEAKRLGKTVELKDISDLQKKYDKMTNTLEILSEEYKDACSYEKHLAALKELKKNKPEKMVTGDIDELEKLIEVVETYNNSIRHLKSIEDSAPSVKGDLKEVSKLIKDLTAKLDKISTKKRQRELVDTEMETLKTSIASNKSKMEKLLPQVQQRSVLEMAREAYAPGNLKLKAADVTLAHIEDSLNIFSGLVYIEPIKFELRTTKTGVSAEAIRNNGERSDISHLSSSEANRFKLLLAYSLLPLLPENKRTNFIVLDEPDANCSDPVRQHLIREFLPKLQSVVPHVFWITPKNTDYFHDYVQLSVVKEHGVSRVEIKDII